MSCDHVRDDLGGYVFDALDPAERDAVAAHLATCPACAAELARFSALPALLARAEGLEIPAAPQAVEERLLDQIARERGAGRRPRLPRLPRRLPGWARGRGLVAGALAGAVLGAAVTAVVLRDDDAATPARSYELRLSGTGGASGRAELSPGTRRHRGPHVGQGAAARWRRPSTRSAASGPAGAPAQAPSAPTPAGGRSSC